MEIETEEHTGQVNFVLHNKITLCISLLPITVFRIRRVNSGRDQERLSKRPGVRDR